MKRMVLALVMFSLGGIRGFGISPQRQASTGANETFSEPQDEILTIDHHVPHISTAFPNAGQLVNLFVRERVGRNRGPRRVVLMIQGSTQPTVPVYDLDFPGYSWMEFLAREGFDAFAMDLQGYGLSPRPRMDDPCNTQPSQQALLIPRPLAQPCPPSYPYKMAIQSDWDEIDRVVDYARGLRGVDTVSLLGWSRGGPRAGGYAASHPEKVDRLFLYSPANYDRFGPSAPPPLPEPGFLMQVNTIANQSATWDGQVRCSNQFNPEVRAQLGAAILKQDPVASAWGDGKLWRAPVQNTLWGWNAETARRLLMPTVIIRGDLDTQAPGPLQRDLFVDLATSRKVFVTVACAAHQMVWENQHMILLNASAEWLRDGTFAGQRSGSFVVGTDGRVERGPVKGQFPAREDLLSFRTTLETYYRDTLRRASQPSYVDAEGDAVWIPEYLRYRLTTCTHDEAIQRVTLQLNGRGVQPGCGNVTADLVFPPRDQTLAFRLGLEQVYRVDLRRSVSSTSVDVEGNAAWMQEYLRYRLNACTHSEAQNEVMLQIQGRGVQPVCQ